MRPSASNRHWCQKNGRRAVQQVPEATHQPESIGASKPVHALLPPRPHLDPQQRPGELQQARVRGALGGHRELQLVLLLRRPLLHTGGLGDVDQGAFKVHQQQQPALRHERAHRVCCRVRRCEVPVARVRLDRSLWRLRGRSVLAAGHRHMFRNAVYCKQDTGVTQVPGCSYKTLNKLDP